jgi:hypothetical protein
MLLECFENRFLNINHGCVALKRYMLTKGSLYFPSWGVSTSGLVPGVLEILNYFESQLDGLLLDPSYIGR